MSAAPSRTSSTSTWNRRSFWAHATRNSLAAPSRSTLIAALLPCNIVVRTEQGRTIVEALDPKIIAEVPGNPALVPIAEEAGQRIQAALDALGTV